MFEIPINVHRLYKYVSVSERERTKIVLSLRNEKMDQEKERGTMIKIKMVRRKNGRKAREVQTSENKPGGGGGGGRRLQWRILTSRILHQ